MSSLTFNLIKHSLKRYTHQNNVRLLSNAVVRPPDEEIEKKENIIVKKFTELNDWYVKFTGLDEIKRLQDRVIITQEKLEKAQEERREVGKVLSEVRKKSTELQEQLHNTKRWENVQRYLDLTKQETEVITMEKDLAVKFEMLDKAEREIFTALSNAVRDSHEKEKAQAEYTKYWGIILSIIGTIVGAVVSTMISTIRNHQIVHGINQGVEEKFQQMAGIIKGSGTEKLHIKTIIAELKNDNTKTSQVILDKISETQKHLNDLIRTTSHKTVLPPIKDGKNDMDGYIKAQNSLLQQHQNEIKKIIGQKNVIFESKDTNWYFIGGLLLLGLVIGKIT